MSARELRASIGLSGLFGLRMLGMFVILPVFAIYAESLPGGDNLTLVGIAIGAYGLTQAILQIPFGWWSDRYGRKPVIYAGLLIFAVGSFIAAFGHHIHVIIVGRVLQGAGAISAAVVAMAADLTRDEHRTKAMAMIGSTIGATFALSLVASPWLNRMIGVPGIFALTGILALAAMPVVYGVVPDVPEAHDRQARGPGGWAEFWRVLKDPQLMRLNYGILALHAVLMALFIAVPFSLRDAGMAVADHWKVYLPVMLGSFALMIPAIIKARTATHVRRIFIGSVALLLIGHAALPWLLGSVWLAAFALLVFFTPFNVLEACLPSLITRIAPAEAKGTAIGVFTSIQFLGTFLGAAAGGYLYQRWSAAGVVALDAALLAIWLALSFGMRVPAMLSARVYTIPELDRNGAHGLTARLKALAGVHEARVIAGERRAYLKVDSAGFDEENVLKLIAGGT
ncbi:MAG: MFS transporter [Betaproteobacteria bacterium]|nr:MFS transporter [Betaproteobacteria bacterium]